MKKLDYTKYVFRPETKLDISPSLLDQLHGLLNHLINTDGLGTAKFTEPRFEYLHKETSLPAKKGIKKDKLDKEYTRTFNVENTLNSPSTQYITEVGKNALHLMREIDQVRVEGIDNGKGVLRTIVEAEMKEQQEMVMKIQKARQMETEEQPQKGLAKSTEPNSKKANMKVVEKKPQKRNKKISTDNNKG